jgi:solute:Na+ symporter, SSS family
MITRYDYFIIAFYFVFLLGIGLVFRRLSKNTSDYFRCGGVMPWWITGTSAWLATFSAWAFVGAAGEVYRAGLNVLIVFYASILALVLTFVYMSFRFRRMRVVTWMEAVRARFGPFTEQFYTWIKLPLLIILSGFALNSIGVFMAAVFHVHIVIVLIVLGTVITIVAFTGGAFAVLASDFVQMFLVMTITLATVVLVLRRPEIGGLKNLIHTVNAQRPDHFNLFLLGRPVMLVTWALAFMWIKLYELNNMEQSTMYLMAKSDKHAKRMVLIPLLGTIVGPLIWIIPPMAAIVMFPNLATDPTYKDTLHFPQPTEAAFVAVAMKVMPVGLLGLLMCAMIGATLTNMDAVVNKGVGVFVRSFYRPMINPNASEKRMLIVGKICTLVFGALIIGVAVLVSLYRDMDLFKLMNQVGVSLTAPLALPIFFGMFFRRTPPWAAWVTALACFIVVAWTNFILSNQITDPTYASHLPSLARSILLPEPLRNWLVNLQMNANEKSELTLIVTGLSASAVAIVFFFGSTFFYERSPREYKERVEAFFLSLRTPLDAPRDARDTHDEVLYRMLGLLCIVYGLFILALVLIPNNIPGRFCFVFCGGTIETMGLILYWRSRVKPINPVDAASAPLPQTILSPEPTFVEK